MLYSYGRTNTDANSTYLRRHVQRRAESAQTCRRALLVYESTNSDATFVQKVQIIEWNRENATEWHVEGNLLDLKFA